MDDFRPTPQDAELFDRIREEVTGHPDDYREAGAWLDGRYSRGGIVGARSPEVPRASDSLGTPNDPRNEPVWRLNCCVVDLLADAAAGELDLTVLPDYERLKAARRIVYVTWLITDPEAEQRRVGASSLEAVPWTEDEQGAFGRSWTRDVAYRDPEAWRALVTIAWGAVEHDRRCRRDEVATALTDPPPRAGTREEYVAYLESSPRTCTKACMGFVDAAVRVMWEHSSGATEEFDRAGALADWPPGVTARGRVDRLIKFKMTELMYEALVLAPTDSLRRTLDLRLQQVLDLAIGLARVLDGVTADKLFSADRRAMRRGPWLEPYEKLQTAAFQLWPLIKLVTAAEQQTGGLAVAGAVLPPAAPVDVEALAQTVVNLLGPRLGAQSPGKPRLITGRVAATIYHVTLGTLRAAVKDGRLTDYRAEEAADNSPLALDEDEVARRWPRRDAQLAR